MYVGERLRHLRRVQVNTYRCTCTLLHSNFSSCLFSQNTKSATCVHDRSTYQHGQMSYGIKNIQCTCLDGVHTNTMNTAVCTSPFTMLKVLLLYRHKDLGIPCRLCSQIQECCELPGLCGQSPSQRGRPSLTPHVGRN